MIRSAWVAAFWLGSIFWIAVPIASAQGPSTDPSTAERVEPDREAGPPTAEATLGRQGLVKLIRAANPMLWPLAVLSVVAIGFILERGFALRKRRVVPSGFVARFLDRLGDGKLDRDRASELCRSNESPIARVFGHAVRYWGQPATAIRQALDHDAASEVLDLRRNVRVLNATATLAPLLGLLGTVVGLIESFDALGTGARGAAAGAGKSEALAHGISLALVATAFGLVVAIVSMTFYYYFLRRVDLLAREIDDQAGKVIDLIAADALANLQRPVSRGPIGPIGDYPRPLGRVEPL